MPSNLCSRCWTALQVAMLLQGYYSPFLLTQVAVASSPSAQFTFYIFILVTLFVLLRLARRTHANHVGTRFSLVRTYASAALYVALVVLYSGLSFSEGVTFLVALPEVVLAFTAIYLSYRYSGRRVSSWKTADGSVYFKGGIGIYIIYIVGLLGRLSIIIIDGPSAFGGQLSGTALYGSMAADLILAIGGGLLIGRYVRSIRRFSQIQRGEESVPDGPPSK
jgi:hypothetical protein